MKKVSVVIPTYNRPDLLHRCLQKLVNQTFEKNEYEIIVVSDGPDETTKLKVSEYKGSLVSVLYCSLPFKQGPAAARNLGWKSAKGILIAFTDDDCLADKNWLNEIWNFYNNEAEVAYTGRVIVPISKHPTDFEINASRLETAEFVTANCICTKEALIKVAGFDERFKAAWREDSDLHFKLLEQNIPIYKNPKAIVVHPVRSANWGVSIKEQKKSLYNALLYKKHPNLYNERIKANPTWLYYEIIFLFAAGIIMLATGHAKVSLPAFAGWLILTALFVARRLKNTSHSFNHVTEMIATSLVIPFLSVFFTLYGAYKFRVLFF
jgi:glycosyltransferase involved in cell wall biosynthesis